MKRASLATEVVPILIKNNLNRMSEDEKLYLYGNDSMSDSDNKAILLATMKFIKETNRFVMQTSPAPLPFPLTLGPTSCYQRMYKFFILIILFLFYVVIYVSVSSCNHFYFISTYFVVIFSRSVLVVVKFHYHTSHIVIAFLEEKIHREKITLLEV